MGHAVAVLRTIVSTFVDLNGNESCGEAGNQRMAVRGVLVLRSRKVAYALRCQRWLLEIIKK